MQQNKACKQQINLFGQAALTGCCHARAIPHACWTTEVIVFTVGAFRLEQMLNRNWWAVKPYAMTGKAMSAPSGRHRRRVPAPSTSVGGQANSSQRVDASYWRWGYTAVWQRVLTCTGAWQHG